MEIKYMFTSNQNKAFNRVSTYTSTVTRMNIYNLNKCSATQKFMHRLYFM